MQGGMPLKLLLRNQTQPFWRELDSNDLELAIVLFISLQCPCPPPGKRAFPPLSSGNDAAYICQEEIQLTGPS
jgi:hypothetical protein